VKRYTHTITFDAVQITDDDFDGPHPNSKHIRGVEYIPRTKTVLIRVGIVRYSGGVGDWICLNLETGELYTTTKSFFAERCREVVNGPSSNQGT